MVVRRCDSCRSCSADVCEKYFTVSVGTDAAKVAIMEGWLDAFVEGRVESCISPSIREC